MEDRTRTEAGRTAAIMLGVLANIYAVLIAFVIVQGWSNLQEAQTFVDAQATALTEIRENTEVLDARDAAPIDRALDAYARSVLRHDFPAMEKDGRRSPVTTQALEQPLRRGARRRHRRAPRRSRSTTRRWNELDDIVSARQSSVTASDGSLPAPLYVLLVLGGVVVVALACVLDSKHRRSHVIDRVLDRGGDRVHARDRRELRPPVHRQHRGHRPADPGVPRLAVDRGTTAFRRATRPTSRSGR